MEESNKQKQYLNIMQNKKNLHALSLLHNFLPFMFAKFPDNLSGNNVKRSTE